MSSETSSEPGAVVGTAVGRPTRILGDVVALAAGVVFAVGLAVGGMTQPQKVIGFLDFAGAWDPSLLLVMAGALAVFAPGSRLLARRGAALDGSGLEAPPPRAIDAPLLVGSALFGLGWGLGGFCPGPAIVSLGPAITGGLVFVGGMAGGQLAFDLWDRRRAARATGPVGTAGEGAAAPPRDLPSCG